MTIGHHPRKRTFGAVAQVVETVDVGSNSGAEQEVSRFGGRHVMCLRTSVLAHHNKNSRDMMFVFGEIFGEAVLFN